MTVPLTWPSWNELAASPPLQVQQSIQRIGDQCRKVVEGVGSYDEMNSRMRALCASLEAFGHHLVLRDSDGSEMQVYGGRKAPCLFITAYLRNDEQPTTVTVEWAAGS